MTITEELRKVRRFEEEWKESGNSEMRPVYHLTGIKGWINDPNGFSFYKDQVHLFYQAHPYAITHGPISWGHAVTDDFVKWSYLPSALAPDEKYDRNGCFSGTALTMPDGRQLLMYTGVDEEGDTPEQRKQTQCIAIGDGVDYEKYESNPVIDESKLPEGSSNIDFRDPKIWMEDDRYYCIAVNRVADGSGAVLLFESDDTITWQFKSIMAKSGYAYGDMWECPDFFSLDGEELLVLSAQGMRNHELLVPGYISFALLGRFDKDRGVFESNRELMIDEGIDFYAPQSLLMPDGRRIMVGWMQNWDTIKEGRQDLDFCGQMAIPREISMREGRLIQNPIRELDSYRTEKISYTNVSVSDDVELTGVSGRVMDLNLKIRAGEKGYDHFYIYLAEKDHIFTRIDVDRHASQISVNRSSSRAQLGTINERSFMYNKGSDEVTLRLLLDRYSLEIFVNEGEQAATFLIYSSSDADGIHFSSDGDAEMDLEKYELKI